MTFKELYEIAMSHWNKVVSLGYEHPDSEYHLNEYRRHYVDWFPWSMAERNK